MNDRLTGTGEGPISLQSSTVADNNREGRACLYAVLAPLIVVILLSFATIFIAINYADRPVADAFSKNGLKIQADGSAGQAALRLGLSVTLLCDSVSTHIVLEATDREFIHPDQLLLGFVHRADARLDRHFVSKRTRGDIYHLDPELFGVLSRGSQPVPGYWQVSDTSGRWLLRMDNPVCAAGQGNNTVDSGGDLVS